MQIRGLGVYSPADQVWSWEPVHLAVGVHLAGPGVLVHQRCAGLKTRVWGSTQQLACFGFRAPVHLAVGFHAAVTGELVHWKCAG